MSGIVIKRVCIIGVGLIGGSFARALRQENLCEVIVGSGRRKANLIKALELGVIDEYNTDIQQASRDADLVVVATPLGAMPKVFTELKKSINKDCIMTDMGSAKACVLKSANDVFGHIPDNFVLAHPIAGTENSGVEASFAELFENRRVILTPVKSTSSSAINLVRRLWEKMGASVTEMSVEHHDEVLAATSHLPHVLAYSIVDTLATMSEKQEIFKYAAGGFKDFTRIASSDPVMWRDICLDNNQAILTMIDLFQSDLNQLKQSIQEKNSEQILKIFKNAKQARDQFLDEYNQ